jgi:DNA-directed RNA polymerase I, II, and III subunit RPABC5
MIIPVRCFTCSKVLADKWEWYVRECAKIKERDGDAEAESASTSRGEIMDRLGLKRICCRRHFLGHVDMMDLI